MRIFTVDEANNMIPAVAETLRRIQRFYARIGALKNGAQAAAAAAEFGGGFEGATGYVRTLYDLGKLTTELHESGVQLKDYSRGLVDFPTMRGGRMVLLCWQLGEPERIEWWHEIEAGFAGRQPLWVD